VKQTLNWRALHQIIPLNFLNPEAEGWPHRAQCLKGKTRNRRYSLVHRISTNGTNGSPIRIPCIPSGDAPEVVACRWLQANKDWWPNLIHVAVLGPQERAVVVSIFSICGCGKTIIYIDIPMQNAVTYLPLRLSILRSWIIQCYSIFSWFTCTYMCNLSKTPWDSTCVILHQGRLHRNVSLLVQSHWKSLTSLTCPHAGKHNKIRCLVSFALFVLHIRTGPLGELAAWQNEAWTEPWRTFQAINR